MSEEMKMVMGGRNRAGCCGKISFNYSAGGDSFDCSCYWFTGNTMELYLVVQNKTKYDKE